MHEYVYQEEFGDIPELEIALPPLISSEILCLQERFENEVPKATRVISKEVIEALGSEIIQAARVGSDNDLIEGFNRAKRLGVLKHLTDYVDLAAKRTILQAACEAGHISSVLCILDTYSYLFKGSIKDIRAFFFAMDNDHFEVCETLLLHWKLIDDNAKIIDYHTVGCILPFACDCSNKRIVELLLQFGADIAINLNTHSPPQRSPLRIAVLKSKLDIVELLIERGAEVEKELINVVYDAMDSKSVATLRFILNRFPLHNARDVKDVLSYACHQGYYTIVRFMIEEDLWHDWHGLKDFDQHAMTILFTVLAELGFAMTFETSDMNCHVSFIEDMQALLGREVMKSIADSFFSTFNRNQSSLLLDFRALLRTGMIYELPVQKISTLVNLSLNDERSVMLCTILAIGLVEDQALTNINITSSLNNMLINACKMRDWTLAEYLMDTGAQFKINSRLRDLLSQLMYNADYVVELIVTHSKTFDVNVRDGSGAFATTGETLLMMVCSLRLEHSVEVLLHAGADVNARDSRNSTALHHLAVGLGQLSRFSVGYAFEVAKTKNIIQLLLRAGADTTITNRYKQTAAIMFVNELRLPEIASMLEDPEISGHLNSSSYMDIYSPGLY